MGSLANKGKPQKEQGADETRWGNVLEEVVKEQQSGKPWWQNVGTFFAWAGGFAVATAALAAVLLLIADLFSKGRLLTGRALSNWIFWSAAILMVIGLVSPTAGDVESLTKKQARGQRRREDRATRSTRRRLRRVYDPWRWRFWAAAVLAFGLAALAGLLP